LSLDLDKAKGNQHGATSQRWEKQKALAEAGTSSSTAQRGALA